MFILLAQCADETSSTVRGGNIDRTNAVHGSYRPEWKLQTFFPFNDGHSPFRIRGFYWTKKHRTFESSESFFFPIDRRKLSSFAICSCIEHVFHVFGVFRQLAAFEQSWEFVIALPVESQRCSVLFAHLFLQKRLKNNMSEQQMIGNPFHSEFCVDASCHFLSNFVFHFLVPFSFIEHSLSPAWTIGNSVSPSDVSSSAVRVADFQTNREEPCAENQCQKKLKKNKKRRDQKGGQKARNEKHGCEKNSSVSQLTCDDADNFYFRHSNLTPDYFTESIIFIGPENFRSSYSDIVHPHATTSLIFLGCKVCQNGLPFVLFCQMNTESHRPVQNNTVPFYVHCPKCLDEDNFKFFYAAF